MVNVIFSRCRYSFTFGHIKVRRAFSHTVDSRSKLFLLQIESDRFTCEIVIKMAERVSDMNLVGVIISQLS